MVGRVVVNAASLRGGALTRERRILRGLDDYPDCEYHVICGSETADALADCSTLTFHEVPIRDGFVKRTVWENTGLMGQLSRCDPDAFYFPLHITNVFDRYPKISAVRNAAPYYPEAHAGATRRERWRLSVLRAATRWTVRNSERIVFMSQATLDRVAREIPSVREKGRVLPHGIPSGFEPVDPSPSILSAYDLPDSYLLTVSNIARYKNLVELVQGYARVRSETDIPPLCIAGKVVNERYAASVRREIRKHDLEESVRLLGYADHDDLPHLHAASELFVFGSACENAPISLVEALACGSPIACSNVASMPEICGDAAVYFDPYDPADIARTLTELWESPDRRTTLRTRALERAEGFDWDDTIAKTNKLFSDIVG